MADKITLGRLLRLYGLYARMDLAWLLRDTRFALLTMGSDILANLSLVLGMLLLAVRFQGIGGMTEGEVFFMAAYMTLVTSLFQCFFGNGNVGHISRRIGRGQIDHMLIMPLPLPVQLMTEGFVPFTGIGNLVSGLVLLVLALRRLELALSPGWLLALLGHLAVSVLLILVYTYLFSTTAFRWPVACEEIAADVTEHMNTLSILPLSGFPRGLVWPLLTVLPTGLMGWFSAMALLGQPPLGLPQVFPLVILIALAVLTKICFQKGLRYYGQYGSNRYQDYGFRR